MPSHRPHSTHIDLLWPMSKSRTLSSRAVQEIIYKLQEAANGTNGHINRLPGGCGHYDDVTIENELLSTVQQTQHLKATDLQVDMGHPTSFTYSEGTSEVASTEGLTTISLRKEVTPYPEISMVAPPRFYKPGFKVHYRNTQPPAGITIVDEFQVRQAIFDFVVAASKQTEDKQGQTANSIENVGKQAAYVEKFNAQAVVVTLSTASFETRDY